MAILNKKSPASTVLPDEVNQYYQSKRRERRGVAVILGVVALIVTLLIGTLLFLGGRFIYQKAFNAGDKSKNTVNVINDKNKANNVETPSIDSNKKPDGVVDAPTNPSPSSSPQTTPTATTNATPALGDEPTTLPSTGDEGH